MALIVVLPRPRPVASPRVPGVVEIVPVAGFDEVQAAVAVRSVVFPSEKIPVAVNWRVVPSATVGFDGLTATDTSFAVDLLEPPPPGQATTAMAIAHAVAERIAEILEVLEAVMAGLLREWGRVG